MFIPGDGVANTPQSWYSSTQRLVQGDSESLLSYQNSSVVIGEKAHYYHFYKCSPCVHVHNMCACVSCVYVYSYMYVAPQSSGLEVLPR